MLPPIEELSYELPTVLDSTMVTEYRLCPRKFFYTYMNHLRSPSTSPALVAGGAFAAGVEAYRKAHYGQSLDHEDCMVLATEAVIAKWPAEMLETQPEKYDPRSLDRIIWAVDQYFTKYPPATDLLRPLYTVHDDTPTFEFSFAVELCPENGFEYHPDGAAFLYCGRPDVLGTYDTFPVFADEKTTIRFSHDWAEQWAMRHQFMGYAWAFRELDRPERSVVVRGIALTRELSFLETQPIRFPPHLLDSFGQELRHTVNRMLSETDDIERCGCFPRAYGSACTAYNRMCKFAPVCASRPERELFMLQTYHRNPWKPLERT